MSSFPASVDRAVGAPPDLATRALAYQDPNDLGTNGVGLTHLSKHQAISDAIHALEVKIGVNGSTDPTSMDYKTAWLLGLLSPVVGLGYTQFNADRVFTPDTTTGGALGHGTFNLTFTISLVLPAFVIGYRFRDAVAADHHVLVDWTPIQYAVAANATSLTAVNAPATNAWVYADLRANLDNNQIVMGTNRFSIGPAS
jgi:hypothetical protein